MELAVVIPVYNEEAVVESVLRKWGAMLDGLGIDYRLCAYDDGSCDGSAVAIMRARQDNEKIVLHEKQNGGHGNTILTGYRQAMADGAKWIFQVDSDDEMGPESFAELWKEREAFDFLVGRRAGRVQPVSRKIVSWVSRLVVRVFWGKSRVWDVNAPYRLMRASAFTDCVGLMPMSTFAPNVVITGYAARRGLRVKEFSVPQRNRQTGEVSIKYFKLLKAAVKSLWQTIVLSIRFPH